MEGGVSSGEDAGAAALEGALSPTDAIDTGIATFGLLSGRVFLVISSLGIIMLQGPGTQMDSPDIKLDGIDRDIAIFLLVFSIGFLAIGAAATVLFWRERNAFEIYQRSAYLVMLTGASFLAVICKIMVNQVEGVFGYHENVYIAKTVNYFAVVCSTCCYGSRTIRLCLQYNQKYRKMAPWLLPERPHVMVCFLLGVAAMIFPLVAAATRGMSDSSEDEFEEEANNQLWIISLVCKIVVIALVFNPFTWGVHDIFNLRRELLLMAMVLLVQIVVGKAVEDSPLRVTRWVDNENLDFAGTVIMFSISGSAEKMARFDAAVSTAAVVAANLELVSVIHPIAERLRRPMESSHPKIEALRMRAGKGLAGTGILTRSLSWRPPIRPRKYSDSGIAPSGHADGDDTNTIACGSATTSPVAWTYEKVVSTPQVSSAFAEFSRKALCQESIFFLRDAATYKSRFVADGELDEEKDNRGGGGGGVDDERFTSLARIDEVKVNHGGGGGGGGGGVDEEGFASLARIVREYILDGAPNEINISSRDKRNILEVYKLGEAGFRKLPEKEKRSVLTKAISEIQFMLESNLMRKFLSTDGFKEAWAADMTFPYNELLAPVQ